MADCLIDSYTRLVVSLAVSQAGSPVLARSQAGSPVLVSGLVGASALVILIVYSLPLTVGREQKSVNTRQLHEPQQSDYRSLMYHTVMLSYQTDV